MGHSRENEGDSERKGLEGNEGREEGREAGAGWPRKRQVVWT